MASRDWPILFRGPLVIAIRENRKDVTRRLGKTWLKAKTGDTIWVRETWQLLTGNGHRYVYKADGEPKTGPGGSQTVWHMTWRPSIFMPRAACRMHLEIISVRQEPLHDLTDEEALREGVQESYRAGTSDESGFRSSPRREFSKLWDEINFSKAPWASNPTVSRIEFKRI